MTSYQNSLSANAVDFPTRLLFMMDVVDSDRCGSEQHLKWLQTHLDSALFEKYFLIFSSLNCPPDRFSVAPLALGQKYGNQKSSLLKRFQMLARFIREHEIDLIHAFTPYDELLAACASRFAKKKIGIVGHRRNLGYALTRKLRIMSRAARQLGEIQYIANSQAAADAAHEKEKISRELFTIIPNPISETRRREGFANPISRKELGVKDDVFLIGCVATIRPIKGHETLLHAAKIVLKKCQNAHFLCVGEQPDANYLTKLKSLAEELDVAQHLSWYDSVDNPYRLLPELDLATLSSYSESFSNSVLEYAASGLPIIASDVGGMREMIADNQTGFLVPPKEPEKLAEKIILLINTPTLCRKFKTQTRQFAEKNFAENGVLEKYRDFYIKTLCKKK
ncbi:MAG: glycosyltransferase family 4 protein [Planctomycetaceae bacterium]|jgi:glycosyltransferase involved in cell wall biosynthesis|nr:glycosyltransferase family 4 protein [Planctomycetaceae bacterium]